MAYVENAIEGRRHGRGNQERIMILHPQLNNTDGKRFSFDWIVPTDVLVHPPGALPTERERTAHR